MKKLILQAIICMTLILTLSSYSGNNSNKELSNKHASEFCQGFEDGFCQGYKDVEGRYAVCPVPPPCPIPPIGCNSNDYRCGYNQGFKKGRRKAYNSGY